MIQALAYLSAMAGYSKYTVKKKGIVVIPLGVLKPRFILHTLGY